MSLAAQFFPLWMSFNALTAREIGAVGTGAIRGKDGSGAYVAAYQSTNILLKRNGVWRVIASHVSGHKRLP